MMFICSQCVENRTDPSWLVFAVISVGLCEFCGRRDFCYDIPCARLKGVSTKGMDENGTNYN